jgi:hypothetical protein
MPPISRSAGIADELAIFRLRSESHFRLTSRVFRLDLSSLLLVSLILWWLGGPIVLAIGVVPGTPPSAVVASTRRGMAIIATDARALDVPRNLVPGRSGSSGTGAGDAPPKIA